MEPNYNNLRGKADYFRSMAFEATGKAKRGFIEAARHLQGLAEKLEAKRVLDDEKTLAEVNSVVFDL